MGRKKASIGSVWRKGSRWVARYEHLGARHAAGRTFTTEGAAWAWLRQEQVLIDRGEWSAPAQRRAAQQAKEERESLTLKDFAASWIDNRQTSRGTPLAPKTKNEYERYLTGRLAVLAAMPIASITRAHVERWWADNSDAPTMRHHSYALLKSLTKDALDRGLIDTDPCRVKHAARLSRQRNAAEVEELVTSLTPLHITQLADHMPPHHRALLLLLAYSGLRPGEAFALTRDDVIRDESPEGVPRYRVKVVKAVSRGQVGPPKTPESNRYVPLPPHLAATIDEHERHHAAPGKDGLLFPSTHEGQPYATLGQFSGGYRGSKGGVSGFNAARAALGRPQLRPYDLRRWARRTWRLAGLSEYECERLLGHKLAAVTGAYHTIDLGAMWPALEDASVAAGWSPPSVATTEPPEGSSDALAGFMDALDDAKLAEVLTCLPDDQRAAVLGEITPARLARVVGKLASPRTHLRVIEGEA